MFVCLFRHCIEMNELSTKQTLFRDYLGKRVILEILITKFFLELFGHELI